ncbi:hypothetical protein EDB83DRAFT_2344642 [Lactarius deliciosus]|nr:hypothetical protein EDB83DRAFT_2344642 [Lactarius deliciosus]
MELRASSSLIAITSLFLLFAGDLVVAQVSAPICTDIGSSWHWSFNSLNQSPCTVTAYYRNMSLSVLYYYVTVVVICF